MLFGRLKDAFGGDRIPLPTGVATVGQLRERLIADNPELASVLTSRAVRFAVGQQLVANEAATPITAADEIAILPPLSGG